MKRRDILLGGAASLGVTTDASAATAATATLKFDPAAVEAALARIDRRMANFLEMDFTPRPPANPEEAELFATRSRVSRAAVRTLYFTGAFMEFEEHERLHPGVQTRMQRLQPEMDAAVDGMAGVLEALSPADRARLQEEFKRDPNLGMKIGEQLQEVAKEDGFGFSRRVDLRVAVDDFARRMRAQNPSLVIDPFVEKTRRIQANPGTPEQREREFMIRAGEQAFWDFQKRSGEALTAWDRVYSARPRVDLAALEEIYPEESDFPVEDPKRRPTNVLKIGGYLMGAGLGSAALGGIFYLISTASMSLSGFAVPALILGVTIGPALLVAGLIVVIVGGIWYSVAN